jgi:hypothetical protein
MNKILFVAPDAQNTERYAFLAGILLSGLKDMKGYLPRWPEMRGT